MTQQPTPAGSSTPPDRWSIWFNRLMQTVGLGMVIYQQAIHKSDVWLLVMAGAMMLGGIGVRQFVRGLVNLNGTGQ